MQLNGELNGQAGHTEADHSPSRKRKFSVTRRVTIRLTEGLHERLEVATDRPGVGKSMVVEAALERFLNPAPPAQDPGRDRLGEMNDRFDRFERDLRMIAETVALHARYHLAVMPPLPGPQQREAALLGDERFKALAEQVDWRVRQGQPLMWQTIDRLNSAGLGGLEPAKSDDAQQDPEARHNNQKPASGGVDGEHASPAAAGEGGSNSGFHNRSNACCSPVGRQR